MLKFPQDGGCFPLKHEGNLYCIILQAPENSSEDWKGHSNNCIFMNAHLKTEAECKNPEAKRLQLMKTREVYNKKHHYKARLVCLLSLEAKTFQSLCVFCMAKLQCYKASNYEVNELVRSLLSQQALVEESDLYLFSPSCMSYKSSGFVC